MSRSLRSYPQEFRESVIERRLKENTKGLGYWAAVDAQNKRKRKKKIDGTLQ